MRPDTFRLAPYAPTLQGRWDALVRASKNGTFLLERGFMEYHRDRFEDLSLVALEGADNLVAVLPAARQRQDGGDWIASHPGLTYGGWIVDERMTTPGMLRLFELLRAWGAEAGLAGLRYKPVPRAYHRLFSDEDLYALFVNRAELVRQEVGSVIDLAAAPGWSKGRRQSLAKARSAGVAVGESADLDGFIALLSQVLAAHGAKPVHTAEELARLRSAFPEQIRLFAASAAGARLAYVLVFDCGQTVHTQYMASGEAGRACGALEAIIDHLQHHAYSGRRYLSFGISTEEGGRLLNHGLIGQKEMFGARAMVSSTYELRF